MGRINILIVLVILPFSLTAQFSTVEERLQSLIEYTDISVQEDSLTNWIKWVQVAESKDKEIVDRNEAWRRFLLSFYRHQETIPEGVISEQTLKAWSQFLTFPFLTGRILDFKKLGREEIETSEIIRNSNNGSRHLLLIPPFGFNNTLFNEFKKRHKGQFTFHEVTFPNGNNSWKYPDKADYIKAEWLTKTEEVISAYLEKLGDIDLMIVSVGTGTYTGLNLAVKHTNIRGIVSINGQFKSDLADPETGDNVNEAYRVAVSNRTFPTPLIIQFSPGVLSSNYAFTNDMVKNQQYLNQITPENVNVILRYNQEFKVQDIDPIIAKLDVPILSLVSVHDDRSPQFNDRSIIRSWQELILDHPESPIYLVKVQASQNLIFLDQPGLFNIYFNKFLEHPSEYVRELASNSKITVERQSPAVTKKQTLETTAIEISYSQTAMKGRKIFGDLVPYGKLWRAGANEATTINLSNDMLINDTYFLEQGKYSLFFIPGEQEWEIVINKIADQWGAFSHKMRFDALRFKVSPTELNVPAEYLNYEIEREIEDKAKVTMTWENTQISFLMAQYFEFPKPSEHKVSRNWKQLLVDQKGDGANESMTDGKALSYLQDKDSLWFKFDLHQYNNKKAFALNLLIDSDFDQSTGSAWFGQNTNFTFDKALTLWMRKSGSGFVGTNGIMTPEDFIAGNKNLSSMNNLSFYLDMDRKLYIVGVAINDLQLSNRRIRVIGAVGEFQTWNDDIGDTNFAVIEIN